MFPHLSALAAVAALAVLPAAAQEIGGMPLRGPASSLAQVERLQPGCPLSQTSVTVGVNKAAGPHAHAGQTLQTMAPNSCNPLVSTQVVAGINLGLGPSSNAMQSIGAYGPRGLLATTTYTRGINIATGRRSTAQQSILNQVGQ